jgi:hypothetical protein
MTPTMDLILLIFVYSDPVRIIRLTITSGFVIVTPLLALLAPFAMRWTAVKVPIALPKTAISAAQIPVISLILVDHA